MLVITNKYFHPSSRNVRKLVTLKKQALSIAEKVDDTFIRHYTKIREISLSCAMFYDPTGADDDA